jgi:hypothetical protein
VRVGFTGHQDLPKAAVHNIKRRIQAELAGLAKSNELTGITSLAEGADQLFASAILSLRGRLEVIVPSLDYGSTFKGNVLKNYKRLLSAASTIRQLSSSASTEEAFYRVGMLVVDECEMLMAVWDGKPSKGLGGTGDVVAYAQSRGIPISTIWPKGTFRR